MQAHPLLELAKHPNNTVARRERLEEVVIVQSPKLREASAIDAATM
jgi:hypothetical protein